MSSHLIQPVGSRFEPMTKENVAEVLGVSVRCIENWVAEGLLPSWRKIGTRCFWHPDAFYGWLADYLKSDQPELLDVAAIPTTPDRPKKAKSAESGVQAQNARRLLRITQATTGEANGGD